MSPLVDKIGITTVVGGLIGCACGYFTAVAITKLCTHVHLFKFYVMWVVGVVGLASGYCVGIYRARRSFAQATGKDLRQILFSGVIVAVLAIAALAQVRVMVKDSSFVEAVRAMSERGIAEIVITTAAPDIRPLVTISRPHLLREFTDKLSAAEIYHPGHDHTVGEGRVSLLMRDGQRLDLEWYVHERQPGDAILGSRARVPRLGPLLLQLLSEGQPGANTP